MAWEQRGKGRYYYRKRRRGRQVQSEYIGAGYIGEMAEQLDTVDRIIQEQQREELAYQRKVDAALDRKIDALAEQVQTLTAATLLAAGCHRTWRKWRVKRGQS